MAHRNNSDSTACHHVIYLLESQLRSAEDLRQRLEASATSPDEHAVVVQGLSRALLDDAVATAGAVATLRDELTGQNRNSAGSYRARKRDTAGRDSRS
jgi:hypothetical protein